MGPEFFCSGLPIQRFDSVAGHSTLVMKPKMRVFFLKSDYYLDVPGSEYSKWLVNGL